MQNLRVRLIVTLLLSVVSFNLTARAQKAELIVQTGHIDGIVSAAFSDDGKLLATAGGRRTVKIWDASTGKLLKTLDPSALHYEDDEFWPLAYKIAFSKNARYLAVDYGTEDETVVWDISQAKPVSAECTSSEALAFTADNQTLVAIGWDEEFVHPPIKRAITLCSASTGRRVKPRQPLPSYLRLFPPGKRIHTEVSEDGLEIKLTELITGKPVFTDRQSGPLRADQSVKYGNDLRPEVISGDGSRVVLFGAEHSLKIFQIRPKKLLAEFADLETVPVQCAFSYDGAVLACVFDDGGLKIWRDTQSGFDVLVPGEPKAAPGEEDLAVVNDTFVAFNPRSPVVASGSKTSCPRFINIFDPQNLIAEEAASLDISYLEFALDEQAVVFKGGKNFSLFRFSGERVPDKDTHGASKPSIDDLIPNSEITVSDGRNTIGICSSRFTNSTTKRSFDRAICDISLSSDKRRILGRTEDGRIKMLDLAGNDIVTIIPSGETNWVVVTPDGRFDTNMSLDNIQGLHWITSDDPLTPKPLELFMRQYYEPGLLVRLLKCKNDGNCDKEFKPLPSIAEINRVQPKVTVKGIKPVANAANLADVTVEVDSATEDVAVSAADKTRKEKLTSGAFDLRLFLDGQLVGVSTPRERLEPFIKAASDLVEKNKKYFEETKKHTNTPEDQAWRVANDVFSLKADNVKRTSSDKVEYTFRNVKLPKDGRTDVEFTAYAFNSDRVKSNTSTSRYTLPASITSQPPKKGGAYVISIGVNASETSDYNLKYAANDARKMQEIVGERLKAETGEYSEVVQVPLISDYGKDRTLAENTAQKAIIKGVFSMLAGNEKEVPADILKQIPNREKIKPVEPEDTLIITYSGHGYADQAGIFYLLPYDIGRDTTKLTPEVLTKMISSDELSLWMQDITAAEMIMVIDACHSSAAVQGDGFKPGPMGSRGLGQLSYDKGMKILSATQADNVALELNSLQQGLLSYALLQDGIKNSLADANKDKQLSSVEWLSYAEKRVPELYQEVKDGKRGVVFNGREIKNGKGRAKTVGIFGVQENNLQQPYLFDFKHKSGKTPLFLLP